MSEHGDKHGAALNEWREGFNGDPEPHHRLERRNVRFGPGPVGRPQKELPATCGKYVLIEEYDTKCRDKRRPMCRIQCSCGLSKPRVIQRSNWGNKGTPAGCRACMGKRREVSPFHRVMEPR